MSLILSFSSSNKANDCQHLLVLLLCFHFFIAILHICLFIGYCFMHPATSPDDLLLLDNVLGGSCFEAAQQAHDCSEWCEVITQHSDSARGRLPPEDHPEHVERAAAPCESCSLLYLLHENLFFCQAPYFWPSNCWEPENTDYGKSHEVKSWHFDIILLISWNLRTCVPTISL